MLQAQTAQSHNQGGQTYEKLTVCWYTFARKLQEELLPKAASLAAEFDDLMSDRIC